MAGFHKLTAGLWQVKVWSTDKGPAGTIQATFVANEVSCVHHLYTVFVVSHQDRIISALLSGYTTRFSQSRSMCGYVRLYSVYHVLLLILTFRSFSDRLYSDCTHERVLCKKTQSTLRK